MERTAYDIIATDGDETRGSSIRRLYVFDAGLL
jgi:hypothetical protein